MDRDVHGKIRKRRKATKQDKEQEERLVAIRQGLFGDRPAAEPSATDRMEVGERERVKVKREREEEKAKDVLKKAKAWSVELRASHSFIDLDPDSPPRASIPSRPVILENPEIPEEEEYEEDVFQHGFDTERADD